MNDNIVPVQPSKLLRKYQLSANPSENYITKIRPDESLLQITIGSNSKDKSKRKNTKNQGLSKNEKMQNKENKQTERVQTLQSKNEKYEC